PKGRIEMRIRGLPAGENTLLTYHNIIDNGDGIEFSPIRISHNGEEQLVEPSVRALKESDAATAYTRLDVKRGQDVVVIFEVAEHNRSCCQYHSQCDRDQYTRCGNAGPFASAR